MTSTWGKVRADMGHPAPFNLKFIGIGNEQWDPVYPEHLERRPGALSGGELQRAALARVLVMEPEVILLDEPTSMLDVITQAQIVDFLRRYQEETGTSYIFITHSTSLAEQVCRRIVRVKEGKLLDSEKE